MGVRDFPTYPSHESASAWGCRQCCGELHVEDAKVSGYPSHRGGWVLFCRSCGFGHWYDLEEKVDTART